MATHHATHTNSDHLNRFYKTFVDIKHRHFDGLIVTGAPVEQLAFAEVDYWTELTSILAWSKTHVGHSLYICRGAQAALYYHYQIEKVILSQKLFGIYCQTIIALQVPLMRGFAEVIKMPHSRHTTINQADINRHPELETLASSVITGPSIIQSKNHQQVFVLGHVEYDANTLDKEYKRDIVAGKDIQIPVNYYSDDDITHMPINSWRTASTLLYTNWLNNYVYQGL